MNYFEVHKLNDIKTSSGLAMFEVKLTARNNNLKESLTVELDGNKKTLHKVSKLLLSNVIGVHTHLLSVGKNKIKFSLYYGEALLQDVSVNLEVEKIKGLFDVVKNSFKKHKVPIFFDRYCDSSLYPYTDSDIKPWFDRPDAENYILEQLSSGLINPDEASYMRNFVRDGFIILEDLIDANLIDGVNKELDESVSKSWQGYEYGSSQRLENLHDHYPAIRKLWLDSRHRNLVDKIFGVRSVPCQSLAFMFGSQQDPHQDLIHLTPFPAGYMCGTWIALQDVEEASGELVVYPGSHRAQRIYMQNTGVEKVSGADWKSFGEKVVPLWREISKRYTPFIYRPKKGTVLIWHENLLHEGSVRINHKLERRSFVIHSFAEGCVAYYDSTGLAAKHLNLKNLETASKKIGNVLSTVFKKIKW